MRFSDSEITLQFQIRLKLYSTYTAISVFVIGALVLFGWQFNIEFLKMIINGLVAMKPV
jgi:hypothetical protein